MNKQRYIANEGKPYTVSPYTLIWDGDYYYMRGFCDERQEMPNFRLDRIAEHPRMLNQIIVMPPEDYTPADYSRHVFRMFDADDAALSAMTGTEDVAVSQMTDMTVLNPRIRWLDSSSTPAAR